MIIKTSKTTAISVAFALWLAYSIPAKAATNPNRSNLATGIVQSDSDDDDRLSGGALAVLLLAIGGAVATVLFAARSNGGNDQLACDRVSNEVTLRLKSTDANGKVSHRTWTGKLDETSGTIKLIMKGTNAAGRATQSQWTGKADGKYYSVSGDPATEEISYTKIDANTLEFKAKKADRVTQTGRMVVSNSGRTLTITTERVDPNGLRIMRQTTYSSQTSR